MVVQDVRWVEVGSQPEGNYTVFYGNGNANHHLGTVFFIHQGIIPEVMRIDFISDRKSYKTLRGGW